MSLRVPIHDTANTIGLFHYRMSVDGRFSEGWHSVVYHYVIGGTRYIANDEFEVVSGGDASGRGISIKYFEAPTNKYVVLQTDSGAIKRFTNPVVD